MLLGTEDIAKKEVKKLRYVVSLGLFLFYIEFNKEQENRMTFIYSIMWWLSLIIAWYVRLKPAVL